MESSNISYAGLNLDFASLTPVGRRTTHEVQKVIDTIYDQGYRLSHHRKFIRRHAGNLAAVGSPNFLHDPATSSSGFTTEADQSDDEDRCLASAPCYVLSLNTAFLPFQPAVGHWFGIGDLQRDPDYAAVDILLPPSDPSQSRVYPRQGYFAFDPSYGRLWLHARHKGIRVDDRPLSPKTKILLKNHARLTIGPYRFIFEFKISDEVAFQEAKRKFLAQYFEAGETYESTSATPSAGDVYIQDWVLHGIVGLSPVSVIHAASNTRSGQVVAVKRLRISATNGSGLSEIQLYGAILDGIRDHKYRRFVMQKFGVLEHDAPYKPDRELYLLWTPLARDDFSSFSVTGRRRRESHEVKLGLFVEALLGVLALHESGWLHRDLKPANLGIVYTSPSPHAVVMDMGQAVRQNRKGHTPKVAHCGTVGYIAPELENSAIAPFYNEKVDVWSMGAVGYFLFAGGRIPWSDTFNMFVPDRNAKDPTLQVFREVRDRLLREPKECLRYVIGEMLNENPKRRPTDEAVLSHPSIRSFRDNVDRLHEADKRTGEKRRLDAS